MPTKLLIPVILDDELLALRGAEWFRAELTAALGEHREALRQQLAKPKAKRGRVARQPPLPVDRPTAVRAPLTPAEYRSLADTAAVAAAAIAGRELPEQPPAPPHGDPLEEFVRRGISIAAQTAADEALLDARAQLGDGDSAAHEASADPGPPAEPDRAEPLTAHDLEQPEYREQPISDAAYELRDDGIPF